MYYLQTRINKIILCGQIINMNMSSELQGIHNQLLTADNSTDEGLSGDDRNQLTKYHSYRFYLLINHVNGTDGSCIVPCRLKVSNENSAKIKRKLIPKKYVCLVGRLYQIPGDKNSSNQSYSNCVDVKSYGKWSANLPQMDLTYVTGSISGPISRRPSFRDLKMVDTSEKADIYDPDNKLGTRDGCDIFLTGYLDMSRDITIFSDNIINISDFRVFNYYNFKCFGKFQDSLRNHLKTLEEYSVIRSVDSDSKTYSENDIFINFKRIGYDSNLEYSPEEILNFHTAMKNKGLVILSGPSGTGKTELVRCYAEALGLLKPGNKSYHYLHIAVSPSWTDDTDLLGYFVPKNKLSGEYYPSATGLVELLYRASKDRNGLYIVLLDEMNLSRIEYYFSQFLSILELPIDDPKRCVHLYSDTYNNVGNKYPSTIHVYDNVLFVGTINVDESTKSITDKVLDRSNVIRIFSSSFKPELFQSKNALALKKFLKHNHPITMSSFDAMKSENHDNSLANNTNVSNNRLALLNILNDLLIITTNNEREIGYREVKQINEYLCDLPDENNLMVNECIQNNNHYQSYSDLAFDHQLSQRILDKLSGNKYELYNFISILDNYMNRFQNRDKSKFHKIGINNISLSKISQKLNLDNKLGQVLESIPHVHSGKLIRHKWMELKYYGFTR